MHIVNGHERFPGSLRGGALAIGNFDGVHRGHQALIGTAVTEARRIGGPAGVMAFEPHPREHFRPGEPHFSLTTLARKLALLAKLGLDFTLVEPFDAALAALSPEDFIGRVLIEQAGVRHVVIGYDFFFGRGRAGTPEHLSEAGRALGFGVSIVAPVAAGGEPFSSSAIRLMLAQGDVKGAAHALGHWWRVAGAVVSGAHIGAGLGFPTANIPLPRGTALGHGIYAVKVHLDRRTLDGAAYLGTRPTFDDGKPVLEVFLVDFAGDLYGREIEVELIDFVRADRKFDGVAALTAQMQADVARVRAVLAAHDARPASARLPLE
jgi:riboflavin kinase/FMN adenylyltransferase